MRKSLKKSFDFFKLSLPIFIGNISILSKFGLSFKISKDGISSLQGAHHVAQKREAGRRCFSQMDAGLLAALASGALRRLANQATKASDSDA